MRVTWSWAIEPSAMVVAEVKEHERVVEVFIACGEAMAVNPQMMAIADSGLRPESQTTSSTSRSMLIPFPQPQHRTSGRGAESRTRRAAARRIPHRSRSGPGVHAFRRRARRPPCGRGSPARSDCRDVRRCKRFHVGQHLPFSAHRDDDDVEKSVVGLRHRAPSVAATEYSRWRRRPWRRSISS